MTPPISDTVFHIKRSSVDGKATTLAGIDRGCSLTKAMYLPKDGEEDTATSYAFHCILYSNDNFLDCLHFLKDNAKLPKEGIIRVTGAGCDKYREKISEILGLDVQFIPEGLSIQSGIYLFLTSVTNPDDCFYPDTQVKKLEMELAETSRKYREALMENMSRNDGTDPIFPFICIIIGSGVGIFAINADGTARAIGTTMVGGKTLIGLGSVIAGIHDYDELMEAAEQGTAGNVDTTVSDVMRDDNSAYGKFPMDLPIFSLGKIVDQKRSIETYEKNDRAASAVRLYAQIIASNVQIAARSEGISKLIFAGHGARGESLRRALMESLNLVLYPLESKAKFLRTGGTGAFGAMLSDHHPEST